MHDGSLAPTGGTPRCGSDGERPIRTPRPIRYPSTCRYTRTFSHDGGSATTRPRATLARRTLPPSGPTSPPADLDHNSAVVVPGFADGRLQAWVGASAAGPSARAGAAVSVDSNDHRGPRGQAVHVVEQVHRVRDPDQPEQRDRRVRRRVADPRERQAAADQGQGRQHLGGQFLVRLQMSPGRRAGRPGRGTTRPPTAPRPAGPSARRAARPSSPTRRSPPRPSGRSAAGASGRPWGAPPSPSAWPRSGPGASAPARRGTRRPRPA